MKPAALSLSFLAAVVVVPVVHGQAPKKSLPPSTTGTLIQRQRASLAGLRAVSVKIAPLPPAVEAAGLHQTTLQTDAEASLKKAGIPVSPASEDAGLLITVRVRPQSNFYVVLVQTEVLQSVRIDRAGAASKRMVLPTWRDVSSGVLRKENLSKVKGGVGQSVAEFIADYKSANK